MFLPGQAGPVLVVVVLVVIAALTCILWPIGRALARRIDAKNPGPEVQTQLEELRARVTELEGYHVRVAELEERLDFAERLLVGHGERPRLDAGRQP